MFGTGRLCLVLAACVWYWQLAFGTGRLADPAGPVIWISMLPDPGSDLVLKINTYDLTKEKAHLKKDILFSQ